VTSLDDATITDPALPTGTARGEVVHMGRLERLVRFVMVGGLGFVVSTAILALLVAQGLPNFVASLTATEIVIVMNSLLHERFTFGTRVFTWRRLLTYNLAAGLGLVITAVAFDLISRGAPDLALVVRNLLAVACGTASNFLLSARFVWGTRAGAVVPDEG